MHTNVPLGFMRMDLHLHTPASSTPHALEGLLERLSARGLSVVAVTDEQGLAGAQALCQLARSRGTGLQVIVGQEIHSGEGVVHGLFLHRAIEHGLGALETVRCIREQGGLVGLPHLFDASRRERMQDAVLERLLNEVDYVETWCGARGGWNRPASLWADRARAAHSAGSDARASREVGDTYVETPYRTLFRPGDLLEALRDGLIQGQTVHPALALMQRMVGMAMSH